MSELKFYKVYLSFKDHYLLEKRGGSRNKKTKISNIKILVIIITYHLSGSGNFKFFYKLYISKSFRKFPEYSWFIRLEERTAISLMCFLYYKCVLTGKCFFIDSNPIKVCHNRRINKHKAFKGIAERGYHSMGWFYGFKIHVDHQWKGGSF